MATAAIVFFKGRKKDDGTTPIKLRISSGNSQTYYKVIIENKNISYTKADWDKIQSSAPRRPWKDYKSDLNKYLDKADNIIKDLEPFSFSAFKDRFFSNRSEANDLYVGFDNRLLDLKAEDRAGTYRSYRDAKISFKKYKPAARFSDIDKEWLNGYVKFMTKPTKAKPEGRSSTTIAIHLRTLKAVVNGEGEDYVKNPFKGFKSPKGKKRTHLFLTEDQTRKLVDYKAISKEEARAQAFWLFSFRANGINFADIAHLQWSNIIDGEIVIKRKKTEDRSDKEIIIPISKKLQKHIDEYGNDKRHYIFDILQKYDTPMVADKKIAQFIQTNNLYTSRIGIGLGFDINVTTTVARHSFATVFYRLGNSLIDMRDALGHSNTITTENYIGSLGLADRSKLKRSDI